MAGSLSSFLTARPGEQQFRVKDPAEFVVPQGDYAAVLGAATPGWFRRFNVGDKVELYQSGTPVADGQKMIRFQGRIRGPSRMPAVTAAEPFALVDGNTVTVAIDEGSDQVVTFHAADFAAIGAARASEVRDAFNAQLTGATAKVTGNEVAVWSDKTGRRSRVEVATPLAALGLVEWAWVAKILVDGIEVVRLELEPGEAFDLTDMGANLADGGADPTTVRFVLELEAK